MSELYIYQNARRNDKKKKILHICSQNNQIPNFMKISPAGAQLIHADEQTDMEKLTVAFRSSAEVPKKKNASLNVK